MSTPSSAASFSSSKRLCLRAISLCVKHHSQCVVRTYPCRRGLFAVAVSSSIFAVLQHLLHGRSVTHLKIQDLIAVTSFLPRCRLKLKEHMQYCIDHPEEISKLAKVQKKISEVKVVKIKNIEKAVEM
ncbi:Vesicle-associated membrane protein [Arachis hypogaea]|nr:Vesicle-associated membrane protein [Arachis hypogaea]